MKNRITKLNKTKIDLSNGASFTIVHDFEEMTGPNSFDASFQNWLSRTSTHTAESFVSYVKNKEPERIFTTLEDYERITAGKKQSATEEEYKAENN